MRTRLEFVRQDLRPADFGRADIGLFVGAVSRRRLPADPTRPAPVPAAIGRWWRIVRGWQVDAPARAGDAPHDPDWLLNLPVPLDSMDDFRALFDTHRPVAQSLAHGGALRVPSALAAAVRAFFAGGGQRCYVLRTGEAPAYGSFAGAGDIAALPPFEEVAAPPQGARVSVLPGFAAARRGGAYSARGTDTGIGPSWEQWRGLQHAYGLDDASFACLPDLGESFAAPLSPPRRPVIAGVPEESFKPCAETAADESGLALLRLLAAPAFDSDGFLAWRRALAHALSLLRGRSAALNRRDMQLVASVPLGLDAVASALALQPRPDASWRVESLLSDLLAIATDADDTTGDDLRHAQLQLVWPWLRTLESRDCPQGLEAPEGAFAGALARNALRQGTFSSIANQPALRVLDSVPRLLATDAQRPLALAGSDEPLAARLTLAALDIDGWRWVSDRTTAEDPRLAIAPLRRLMAQVERWARRIGHDFVHEPSNEATWFRVRVALQALGRKLFAAGALDGPSPEAAFDVICDRRTMTTDDIEAGRLIVRVSLQPALPVERIVVTLALLGAAPAGLLEAA
jgi:hypothetical protein